MAPRVVIVSLTTYLAETLTRFGLLREAFSTSDMKTGHFNAGLARARDVLEDDAQLAFGCIGPTGPHPVSALLRHQGQR